MSFFPASFCWIRGLVVQPPAFCILRLLLFLKKTRRMCRDRDERGLGLIFKKPAAADTALCSRTHTHTQLNPINTRAGWCRRTCNKAPIRFKKFTIP